LSISFLKLPLYAKKTFYTNSNLIESFIKLSRMVQKMAKHRKEDVKKTEVKRKKKIWVSILAPKQFNNIEIGETLCEEPKQLLGRNIDVNLMVLTNDPKKQNVKLKFKVKEVKGEKVEAEVIGYELNTSHVRRVVRRGSEKIDDSFLVETKDNIKYRIKPLLLTRYETKRSILSAIKVKMREIAVENFKKNDSVAMLNSIVSNSFQREAKDAIKKIYPIAICEVRMLHKV